MFDSRDINSGTSAKKHQNPTEKGKQGDASFIKIDQGFRLSYQMPNANTPNEFSSKLSTVSGIVEDISENFMKLLDDQDPSQLPKPYLIRLALDEAFANQLWHDALGYHGQEAVDVRNSKCTDSKLQHFQDRVSKIAGRTRTLELGFNPETKRIYLKVDLINKFPDFEDRWKELASKEITAEDLVKPHGRGLFYLKEVFPKANYTENSDGSAEIYFYRDLES